MKSVGRNLLRNAMSDRPISDKKPDNTHPKLQNIRSRRTIRNVQEDSGFKLTKRLVNEFKEFNKTEE